MSDNVFILSSYKNYSLDLLNSSIYFFFACIVAGNFSICLSKLSSSDILNSFIEIIDNILEEIFKEKTGYNPYELDQRNLKIDNVFRNYLNDDATLNESNPKINELCNIGSTKSVKFDLIVNKDSDEYYLVYYKLKKEYIKKFLLALRRTLYNSDGFSFLISFLFRYFLLTSIKIVNIYLFILSMCNEHALLLFFSLPFSVLKYIYGFVPTIITIGYICYFVIYLFNYFGIFVRTFYNMWNNLYKKINEPLNSIITKYGTSSILIVWVGFVGFWTVILQLCVLFFCILGFIIATGLLLFVMSIYISFNIFGFLYTLIRIGFFGTRGFFVEESDPPYNKDNKKDQKYTFTGNEEFTLQSSFVYTYLKYTLWYYLLYVIFIVFPVTEKIFGVNVIVPFIMFTMIGYLVIRAVLNKLKETIIANNDVTDPQITSAQRVKAIFTRDPSYAQSVTSFFYPPSKARK
jgi:hypothetical protein